MAIRLGPGEIVLPRVGLCMIFAFFFCLVFFKSVPPSGLWQSECISDGGHPVEATRESLDQLQFCDQKATSDNPIQSAAN